MGQAGAVLQQISYAQMAARAAFPTGLFQPPGAYHFGADALLLGAFAAEVTRTLPFYRRKTILRAAEAGCGCGAALLAFALARSARCLGIEREAELARAAKANAVKLGFAENMEILTCDLADHGAFACHSGVMDVVMANPPWRKQGSGRLPESAMRARALHGDTLHVFCKAAARLLVWHGCFCVIIRPDMFCGLCEALQACGLGLRVAAPLAAHADRPALRMLAMARKGAAAEPVFEPMLVLHGASGEYTPQALAFCPWLAKKRGA